jgi:hypothetical protein
MSLHSCILGESLVFLIFKLKLKVLEINILIIKIVRWQLIQLLRGLVTKNLEAEISRS